MDLVGSIIYSKGYTVPVIKKELSSDDRTHNQGNERKKTSNSASKNVSNPDKKSSYECPICYKIYTVRKTFVAHKNNHKRNEKLKALGIHPFDKEACLKLKASKAMSTAISESKLDNDSNDNFKVKVKSELPVKSMTNDHVTVNPISVNGNSKVKPESPAKSMINPDAIANTVSVNGCNSNSKMKSEMPLKFTMYHDVTENPMRVNDYNDNFKLPLKSKLPLKLMINPDVTANPMSCAADWAPPERVESHNDVPPPIVSPIHLVSEDSSQIKRNPPAKKTFERVESHDVLSPIFSPIHLVSGDSSQIKKRHAAKKTLYECNMCGRTSTNKKALLNHRTNHMQNKKKQKFLFYDRPNKQNKKSYKIIMRKAK